MAVYALINKEVIPYICKGKNVSKEFLHTSTKLSLEKLNKWFDVSDTALPTVPQAKKIALTLHIPFAGLYMNISDIKIQSIPTIKNFRTFDGSSSIDDSSLNIAICDVLREREFLIHEGTEFSIPIPALSLPQCVSTDPIQWASTIRSHYHLTISEQYRLSSSRQFYLYLREKIEQAGIFVQCYTDVSIDIARGFAIYDTKLPIIGLNDDDRPPAKSFSLIHELVHLMKRESSLCNDMNNSQNAQKEEVFCNAVAGEVLVPHKELKILLDCGYYNKPYSLDDISKIAKKFSVSREVIVRRLLDLGEIDTIEYQSFVSEFRRELEVEREKQKIERQAGINSGIPRSISREAIDRTSPTVCKMLYYGYGEEIYSKKDIANHLGIAQKHVDKFLMEVARWSN